MFYQVFKSRTLYDKLVAQLSSGPLMFLKKSKMQGNEDHDLLVAKTGVSESGSLPKKYGIVLNQENGKKAYNLRKREVSRVQNDKS